MSDVFSVYEDKFNDLANKMKEIINTLTTSTGDKAETALSVSIALFKEAEGVLHQMEIETLTNGTLSSLNKVKQCNTEFDALQNKFQIIQDKYITQKAENVIILGTEDNESKYIKQKKSGLIANENGGEELKLDSIDISNSQDQRKISSSKEKNNDMSEIQDSTFNFQAEKQSKMILIITIVIIVIVFVFLIVLFSVLL